MVTSDDRFTAGSAAFGEALAASGQLTRLHLATDHSYSDRRIALHAAVLQWLQPLRTR